MAQRSSETAAGSRLTGYRAKRDFDATPEPAPGDGATADARQRFVIHEHHARSLHWDLRLERDGTLASWAVPKGLPPAPGENHFAAATEDHPLEYLDFHGEIPKGQYGAGTIHIWDSGAYDTLKWEPRKIEVALHGQRESARYALFAIDNEDPPKDWMIHRMDPPADLHRQPMPKRLAPMLARSGELPADDHAWAYEIKWDGVRALAYSRPRELRLESRTLKDITDLYPELNSLGAALGSHQAVLDGEIVAFDENGRPSFAALQGRMHTASRTQAARQARTQPVTYAIFDLLWLDGHSLMDDPYERRHARLIELALSGERLQVPDHVVGHGRELLRASAEQGLEGVVAKRLDSSYRPGARSGEWVKVKTVQQQELVVGGWMPGKGKRRGSVGALLLGVSQHGRLRYVGRVGSGFSDQDLQRLSELLGPLERDSSPFDGGEKPPREAVFCEPQLVVEVRFAHWTAAGNLRHPVFLGLRDDKPAEQVVRESPSGEKGLVSIEDRQLKLSNQGKVLYPQGFTKGQLIDYYRAIAPVLLGHLCDRALTVTRWPDGVEGKSFFQKQAPAHRPEWVRTVSLPAGAKRIDYTLANDLPTLVWLANLAAIELHVPLALSDHPERPTALVFDLDPGAPATAIQCARVALQLHGMFDGLGLQSFVKTSGSKGLQVYVPLNNAKVTFEHTKAFAKTVAELLESEQPQLVVSRMSKAKRPGKVLIDWSQNDRNKTTVCVYSLRATQRPTASTPLEWEEVQDTLDGGDPSTLAFEASETLQRVEEKGDLFAPVLSLVQRLPPQGE
jgi:bifunctional non-homologous end joining protein LigD